VQTVAVTVNAVKEFSNLGWRKQLKNFSLAQLHGEEAPMHVKAVGKYLPVIKVFPAVDSRLVTASGLCKLAGDGRKDALDLSPESDQNRDGDDGNKSQDQGVLDEGLAFSGSLLAAGLFFGIHTITQLLI
jgi:phosphoribosylanthranilate isomerase